MQNRGDYEFPFPIDPKICFCVKLPRFLNEFQEYFREKERGQERSDDNDNNIGITGANAYNISLRPLPDVKSHIMGRKIFNSSMNRGYRELIFVSAKKHSSSMINLRSTPCFTQFTQNYENRTIDDKLSIYHCKHMLIDLLQNNQVLIVTGETGSGKTTQIPQILHEAGYAQNGLIGCTNPRRVAARMIATRVSEEFGCELGNEVGYKIRFDDRTSDKTLIKYMTDGVLLWESFRDSAFERYSCIIVDEAHERSLQTEVLLGLIKKALECRPDLKLIISSATLDIEKFLNFFNNAQTLAIPGRQFRVEIFYAKYNPYNYLDAAIDAVIQIHKNEGPGDILVFLTGEEDIMDACEGIEKRIGFCSNELRILPFYSALTDENILEEIFGQPFVGQRRVIIATNVTETSLTLNSIRYVVDSGYVKEMHYHAKKGIQLLDVCEISQAQSEQRKGRVGRTAPGKCFRLYTEEKYGLNLNCII